MPSVTDERAMRDLNRSLQSQGLEGKFDLSLNEKRQWWKPDGTPLPFGKVRCMDCNVVLGLRDVALNESEVA